MTLLQEAICNHNLEDVWAVVLSIEVEFKQVIVRMIQVPRLRALP